ncbi:hypothetical protein BCF44_103501 [Kutzneria buriramensis]|uniref:Uncharacterized protein n=1 Tax=Kutzneria buriramensis TaxID=1045776 RepID=A0A3E0I004_9PSEU|nr:hypothetical protein BCF44_103501 [Kutzneria buriramensis]
MAGAADDQWQVAGAADDQWPVAAGMAEGLRLIAVAAGTAEGLRLVAVAGGMAEGLLLAAGEVPALRPGARWAAVPPECAYRQALTRRALCARMAACTRLSQLSLVSRRLTWALTAPSLR